jgi:predicted transposase YbfD/YdcC
MIREKLMPKHIKKKEANHPGKDLRLIEVLDQVPDPRGASCNFQHPLTSILFIVIATSLSGANNWIEIVAMANSMKDWIGQFVDISSGIPSVYTFDRVFCMIESSRMEEMLRSVMGILREKKGDDIIAFDGKSMRATADANSGLRAIHLLNAWSVENKICLGQRKVDDKSNEITALPELMDLLDLKGTIITTDALNTQKEVAEKAIEKDADYVLPVKGNHPILHDEIISAFKSLDEEQIKARAQWEYSLEKSREHRDIERLEKLLREGAPNCGAFKWENELEKDHGRLESRIYTIISAKDLPSKDEWQGLESLVRVQRERVIGEKIEHSEIYYITSLKADNKKIAKAIREHWGVECLHWGLDVVLREDKSRYRDRIGASNLATLRKIVMGALERDKTLKCGKAAKRLVAASDAQYREKILKNLF